MKKDILNKEQSLTSGALILAIVAIIAQLAVLAKILKLISRGNKALKIYINKNEYYNKLNKADLENN